MMHTMMKRRVLPALLACGLALVALRPMAAQEKPADHKSTSSGNGWTALFDGKTTAGWRAYKSKEMPPGWTAADGVLSKSGSVEDIVSDGEYGNFEFETDWKISDGGNAGIFYRGTEEYEKIYWSGPEYQLLDDDHAADNKTRLTCAGAAYGIYPSPPGHLKPVGEWNTTRIVAKGPHIEHWLNGFKLLEYEVGSPDWEAKVQASKFAKWPHYGRAPKGHFALQGDHNGALAFRNIRIREF